MKWNCVNGMVFTSIGRQISESRKWVQAIMEYCAWMIIGWMVMAGSAYGFMYLVMFPLTH